MSRYRAKFVSMRFSSLLDASGELRPEDGSEFGKGIKSGDVSPEGGSVSRWNVEEVVESGEGGGEALQTAR